jgi:YidC/Oxa1 family membrane protein insertase
VRTTAPSGEDPAARPLGGLDPAGKFRLEIVFGDHANGLSAVRLADHFTSIKRDAHILVQSQHPMQPAPGAPVMAPFAAVGIKITPQGGTEQTLSLIGGPQGEVWREVESTDATRSFEATILDASAVPIVRITRTFALTQDSFDITLTQRIDNISPVPMTVTWAQRGPVDLDREKTNYGGDKRRVRYGYLLPPEKDPSQSIVMSDKFLDWHQAVLGKREPMFGPNGLPRMDAAGEHYQGFPDRVVWPNSTSIENKYALVWAAMTDRYFAVSVHPLAPENATGQAKTFQWVNAIQRVVLDQGVGDEVIGLRLESKPMALAPGASADVSVGIYAGPLDRDQIAKESLLSRLGLPGLVVYNFGGPCGFCTFSWLTHLLLWLLHTLHDLIFFDWALSIIFLVVIVRTCLHPLTRWSQRKMALFGKQMGAMAPKQKALQEKFKGDPAKLQAETAKLWKEEGISPTGLLGCLPAFFQMPVWIALYATLYFAVELRHQPAFYGVFQSIQPMSSPFWRFLGDLSEPDRLFYFGAYYNVPLLSGLMGPIHSINILPLVLGVVFFIQQKYLTPPTTGQLTPEQEMQQKMIKVMTVVMFPFFMYNAPSGLALYFIANSSLAIIESKWIRANMEKQGLLDLDKLKAERERLRAERQKSGAKGGFLERVSVALQQRMEEAQKAQASGKKPVTNERFGRKSGR